jgi:hypothetical protein
VIDAHAPGNVGTPSAAANSNQQAILTWTDPSDSDYKQVNISWSGGSTGSTTVLKGTQTYTTGLLPVGSYTFTFKTQDIVGNIQTTGIPTTPALTIAAESTPPGIVTGLSATPDSGKGTVTLNWTYPTTGVTPAGVTIAWSDGISVQSSYTYTSVITGSTSWTTPVLTSGQLYTFTLVTVDSSGDRSDEVSTTATPTVSGITISSIDAVDELTDGTSPADYPKVKFTLGVAYSSLDTIYYWDGTSFPSTETVTEISPWVQLTGNQTYRSFSNIPWGDSFSFYVSDGTDFSETYTVIYNGSSLAYVLTPYSRSLVGASASQRVTGYSKRFAGTSSSASFFTPVFPDTPSTYGQAQPDQVPAATRLNTDLVMEPISMRFAPTVASQTGLSRSIDSSGLSIIQRYAKAAAALAARATAAAKENANAMNTPIQNVRYSLPMTASESSATETASVPASPVGQGSSRTATGSPDETTGIAANVRPVSVSATENALPRVQASASPADAASLPKGQKNPVPKGETVPRPDFYLRESGENREEGEEILEDEEWNDILTSEE